jgi:hypothetical protein
MKIRLTVASANLGDDKRGGLHEEHDVRKDRAEYLISIGAAVSVDPPAKTEKKAEEKQAPAPAPKKAAPAPRPATRKQN